MPYAIKMWWGKKEHAGYTNGCYKNVLCTKSNKKKTVFHIANVHKNITYIIKHSQDTNLFQNQSKHDVHVTGV